MQAKTPQTSPTNGLPAGQPRWPALPPAAPAEAVAFDRRLAAQYGLDDVQPLSRARPERTGVSVARVAHAQPHLFVLDALPADDAFVLHVDLAPGGVRRFAGQPPEAASLARPGSVHLQDLQHGHTAYLGSPFDAVVFHYPRASLQACAAELGRPGTVALRCPHGEVDPVVVNLSLALLGAASQREAKALQEPLFIDQLSLALGMHLIGRYAGAPGAPTKTAGCRLSAAQLRRAQAFLIDNLGRRVTLAEVAAECGLSRSHFIRAFKQAVGQTPHDWLTDQRLDVARRLLGRPGAVIADVALASGFADQSHLTRVFSRRTGTTPAAWRASCG